MPGVVFVALLAASSPRVCLEAPAPNEIRARLAKYLRTTNLAESCTPSTQRISFQGLAGRTKLKLTTASGVERTRTLPWLLDLDRPLQSLAETGHLSELAVMIQGLVLANLLPAKKVTTPVVKRRPRRPPARPTPAPAPRPVEPEPIAAHAPVLGAPLGTLSAATAPAVTRTRVGSIAVVSLFRWRSPGVSTIEVAGQLALEHWFIRAGGSPSSGWSLEGRPIRVTALNATGGYVRRLRLASSVDWFANLAIGADLLTVRRTDIDDAKPHRAVDLLGILGSGVAYRPWPALSVAALVEGLAAPTARAVTVPDGPETRLNRWGWRAGLQVSVIFDQFVRAEDQSGLGRTSVE